MKRLVVGGIALLAVVSTIAAAFSPWLLVNAPLALVVLNPDGRHIVLASAEVPPVPLWLVASARRFLSMLLTWGLGATYGHAAVSWTVKRFPRFAGFVHWSDRLLQRTGPAILALIPGYTITMLAGVAGLSFRRCAAALAVGVLLMNGATVWFGSELRSFIQPLVAWLTAHVVEATLVTAVVIGGWQLVSRLRGKKGLELPPAD
ncbi:MAG: hypothetical protein H6742_17710 [Alphaproteobacteria bacterium]|nr:hypothetical protein [Alphaproteobacteria bacterium]